MTKNWANADNHLHFVINNDPKRTKQLKVSFSQFPVVEEDQGKIKGKTPSRNRVCKYTSQYQTSSLHCIIATSDSSEHVTVDKDPGSCQ